MNIPAYSRAAHQAAEQLAKQTGAPFTIALAAFLPDKDGNDLVLIMGAWVPEAKIAAAILRHAADSIDGGHAEITDLRRA